MLDQAMVVEVGLIRLTSWSKAFPDSNVLVASVKL